MNFWGVQNATFDENPYENERIRVILGCAINSIARAKHRCTGGWLIICDRHSVLEPFIKLCMRFRGPYPVGFFVIGRSISY